MFYCDECRVKNKWPEGFVGSRGRCEVCGKVASCNDVPSSALPDPPSVPPADVPAATPQGYVECLDCDAWFAWLLASEDHRLGRPHCAICGWSPDQCDGHVPAATPIQTPTPDDLRAQNSRLIAVMADKSRYIAELEERLRATAATSQDAGEMESFIAAFLQWAPSAAQLLDGWHADGTAWSEWDTTVRDELSRLMRQAILATAAPSPTDWNARIYESLTAAPSPQPSADRTEK